MTKNSQVIWTEGLFLQPQHFQQQNRYLENEIHQRFAASTGFYWGFLRLQLNLDLLKTGKLGIESAEGFFQDGTYFNIPHKDPAPAPIDISKEESSALIYLCLPDQHWNSMQVQLEQTPQATARIRIGSLEAVNTHEPGSDAEALQVGMNNTCLRNHSDGREGFHPLPIAKLIRKNQVEWAIDPQFIPPFLNTTEAPNLINYISKIKSAIDNKIQQLQIRKFRKSNYSSSETGDFLLLQTALRYRGVFDHFLKTPLIHPEYVYLEMVKLMGDITLFSENPDLHALPDYLHENPSLCFLPLSTRILETLAGLHDQHAVQIPLQEKTFGIHLAMIADKHLLANAYFVLVVYAEAPDEQIRKQLPVTVKIGPADQIRDLVNLNLPGIRLNPLQQAPRALPYYADHQYFQLDTKANPTWKQLENSQTLALHYAGNLPSIRFELWAIRKDSEALM